MGKPTVTFEEEKSRIQLGDTTMTVMTKMSEGNPGAINALMDIFSKGEEIDPQSFCGALGPILTLDTLRIYGTGIYVLWNDKCDRDARRMIMLLRAFQLGHIKQGTIQKLANDQMNQKNLTPEEWADLEKKVLRELKEFARGQS